jgi:hypothetical protein
MDPIGIAGGLNVYGFAGGDPINFGDPFGLHPCQGAGAAAAAGVMAIADGPVLPVGDIAAAGCLLIAGGIAIAASAGTTWDSIKAKAKSLNRWRRIVGALVGGLTGGDDAATAELPPPVPWEQQVAPEPRPPQRDTASVPDSPGGSQ